MRPRLRPTDVLEREPSLQLADLPEGRLLVRHPRGVSLVDGVTRGDAEAVLAQVDGRRTAEEVCDALAGTYDTRRAVTLLRRLFGDALRRVPAPVAGRVLVAGNGAAGRRLAQLLERGGCGTAELVDDPAAVAGRLQDADLAVVAFEETPYRTLSDVQAACLGAGVTSLYVTFDADGTRVGPSVVPGRTPCLACAHAGLGALPLGDEALAAAAAKLRTLSWDAAEDALRAAADEARRLLAEDGEPRLLARIVTISPAGRFRRPVTWSGRCPLRCREAAAAGDRFAGRAAEDVVAVGEDRGRSAAPAGALVASVGVLGGGTAGYLVALALRRKLPHLRVTLLESSAVPAIGVGEATTPLMPQFLHADLGLDVHRLFHRVRPTLKLGIRFLWGPPGGDFNYPFGAVWPLEALVHDGHLRYCSLASMRMAGGRLPVLDEGGRAFSRLDTEVAYHLDNARLVAFLRDQALAAGVERVDATVADAVVADGGATVRELVADDGRRFAFDLYVDCSGFRSLLIEKALGSPFVSFGASLFTDRAWVATAPLAGDVPPYTLAETLSCGWMWSTPQADEDHRGYVFSSAFADPEEALEEMRRRVPGMGEARLVKFRAGRHEHFWKGNVVALGNAYGFVEPLESTALHMLIRQIGLLLQSFPLCRGGGPEGLLNRKVAGTWDYLRWFLALHYKFNRRLETPFWRACRNDVDVSSHGELLESFAARGPLSYDRVARRHFDYPDPLWGAEGVDVLLLAQEVAARLPRPPMDRPAWERRLELCRAVVERSLSQRRALELFDEEPVLLERMAAAFRAAGPAFPI